MPKIVYNGLIKQRKGKIMAYMNQQKKSVIKTNLDKALKGTGVKFSLSVQNNSSICCTIKSAPIDLLAVKIITKLLKVFNLTITVMNR